MLQVPKTIMGIHPLQLWFWWERCNVDAALSEGRAALWVLRPVHQPCVGMMPINNFSQDWSQWPRSSGLQRVIFFSYFLLQVKFHLTESRLHWRQCSEMCSKLFLPGQCSPDITTVFEDKKHEAVKCARFEYLTKILIKLAVLAGYVPVNSHGKCVQILLFFLYWNHLFSFSMKLGKKLSAFLSH